MKSVSLEKVLQRKTGTQQSTTGTTVNDKSDNGDVHKEKQSAQSKHLDKETELQT